jgi:hypothetical protein
MHHPSFMHHSFGVLHDEVPARNQFCTASLRHFLTHFSRTRAQRPIAPIGCHKARSVSYL